MGVSGKPPQTIYIGGGTPTSLPEEQLGQLMEILGGTFDLGKAEEFTVEAGRPDSITREKLEVELDRLEEKAGELMETIQREMLERARTHRDAHTYEARDFEEFQRIFAEKTGFVKAMWCGEQACEDLIKEKMSVTSRCMPFVQEQLADTCVCCGKPAKKMVYWGKAY